MIRRTIRLLAAALVAAFAVCSVVEAAPPKTIRHRTKHSSRTSTHRSSAKRKPAGPTLHHKAAPSTAKRQPHDQKSTVHKPAAKPTARVKRPVPKNPSATKPR